MSRSSLMICFGTTLTQISVILLSLGLVNAGGGAPSADSLAAGTLFAAVLFGLAAYKRSFFLQGLALWLHLVISWGWVYWAAAGLQTGLTLMEWTFVAGATLSGGLLCNYGVELSYEDPIWFFDQRVGKAQPTALTKVRIMESKPVKTFPVVPRGYDSGQVNVSS